MKKYLLKLESYFGRTYGIKFIEMIKKFYHFNKFLLSIFIKNAHFLKKKIFVRISIYFLDISLGLQ